MCGESKEEKALFITVNYLTFNQHKGKVRSAL